MRLRAVSARLSIDNFIVLTSFVNGYIYFAAHLDDLENVAKKLAPDGIPVQRSKAIEPQLQREEPRPELRVDYYEDLETVMKDYHDASENLEGETAMGRTQRRKVHEREPNIDQLAKKIKDRVLKELAEEFLRLKKRKQNAQRGRHGKERKETNHLQSRFINVERQEVSVFPTTPKASMFKREKHVRPIHALQEEQIMPSTKKLMIRPPLNSRPKMSTRPKMTTEEEETEMPIIVKSDEIEVERIDIGVRNNDSYEYYVVPPKDEILFETGEETRASPPPNMVRYKIQSHPEETLQTTRRRPQQKIIHRPDPQDPMYAQMNSPQTESKLKVKGNDDTYILYEMESNEGEPQLQMEQRTTPKPTQNTKRRITQKMIRMTRPRYTMTSPDYYASLPTIAERYDFNEPIPTKDRVRSI